MQHVLDNPLDPTLQQLDSGSMLRSLLAITGRLGGPLDRLLSFGPRVTRSSMYLWTTGNQNI